MKYDYLQLNDLEKKHTKAVIKNCPVAIRYFNNLPDLILEEAVNSDPQVVFFIKQDNFTQYAETNKKIIDNAITKSQGKLICFFKNTTEAQQKFVITINPKHFDYIVEPYDSIKTAINTKTTISHRGALELFEGLNSGKYILSSLGHIISA
jgi:hypothetical protein